MTQFTGFKSHSIKPGEAIEWIKKTVECTCTWVKISPENGSSYSHFLWEVEWKGFLNMFKFSVLGTLATDFSSA